MREKLHTADHILCTVLERDFGAKTKGMEFREKEARITFECIRDLREMRECLEERVNAVIGEERDVILYVLPPEKAKEIVDCSLLPEGVREVKIYEIVGFNKVACMGPHVKNTREIGRFRILKIEKKGRDAYSIFYTVE